MVKLVKLVRPGTPEQLVRQGTPDRLARLVIQAIQVQQDIPVKPDLQDTLVQLVKLVILDLQGIQDILVILVKPDLQDIQDKLVILDPLDILASLGKRA